MRRLSSLRAVKRRRAVVLSSSLCEILRNSFLVAFLNGLGRDEELLEASGEAERETESDSYRQCGNNEQAQEDVPVGDRGKEER